MPGGKEQAGVCDGEGTRWSGQRQCLKLRRKLVVEEIGSEAQGGVQCLEQGNKLVCGRGNRR